MRNIWLKSIAAVAVVAVAAGGGWYAWRAKTSPAHKFKSAKVERGPIKAGVTANGTVNPVSSVLVGTQVSGRIKGLHADFNSRVRQGELLAEIDPLQFQAQLDQAKANLAVADAALERADAALRDAARSHSRARTLFSGEVISQYDMDTAETNHDYAKAQAASARASKAQAQAAVELAETNLRYTRILSPVNGTVISRNVDVGQTVVASFQTPTLFTIAKDLGRMQINTAVNEADIGKVETGQPVSFTVDAYPDTPFTGAVSQIRLAPSVAQNVVTYDVVITVDNPGMKLKPGMTANVSIIIDTRENVLKVPNAALRFRPPAKEGDKEREKAADGATKPEMKQVWVNSGGAPKRVPVTTGISDGNFTEVSSPDIKEGTEVLVSVVAPNNKNGPGGGGHRLF